MITLTKFSYINEADMICMKLQEAGIESFIADQGITSVNALYSGAIGGIRIQIDENDLEKAKEILFEAEPVDTGIFQCPQCSSDDVEYEKVSKRAAFISLLLINMPVIWAKRKCTCNACGHLKRSELFATAFFRADYKSTNCISDCIREIDP
jgi:hypothetical protein